MSRLMAVSFALAMMNSYPLLVFLMRVDEMVP